MPSEYNPHEDIKNLVDKIIAKNGLLNVKDVEYREGSEVGDGYVSKTVAVEISHQEGVFSAFMKYAQDVKSTENVPIDKLYANEIYFYDVVYPVYLQFLRDKRAEEIFHHAPVCYGTSEKSGIVALENIKHKGYVLWKRGRVMNRPHLESVLRTFARFHAVSFAFKDQEKEKYGELLDNSYGNLFSKIMNAEGSRKMITTSVDKFLDRLDPVQDKRIVDKCDGLSEKLLDTVVSVDRCPDEYSILTQGDCWCNNMMFLYPDEDRERPEQVILIDWQLLRKAPPAFDIAYFFYTIASEEALADLDGYLKLYHRELTLRMKELGSDPDILYPYKVLRQQWKQHGLYGFAMAFMLIRMMLCAPDEVVSMEGLDFESVEDMEKMCPKIKREDEFVERMKILAVHFIDNDML